MSSRSLAIASMVLVVCLLAAAQVWLSHIRVGTTQEIVKLKQEKELLQQDLQNLKIELASMLRPDTLRRLAREKMGMHAPTPLQVVTP